MIAAVPTQTPPIGEGKRFVSVWGLWFQSLKNALNALGPFIGSLTLVTQSASIASTTLLAKVPAAGLYRVSWYARITRAATTSSSLTVTVTGTDSTLSVPQSGVALTGNTTTTAGSGLFLVRMDGTTALKYSTTYASVGGTSMQYTVTLVTEQIPEVSG